MQLKEPQGQSAPLRQTYLPPPLSGQRLSSDAVGVGLCSFNCVFFMSLIPSPGLKTWQAGLKLPTILFSKVCVRQNVTEEGSP